jgi:hypothetical protein
VPTTRGVARRRSRRARKIDCSILPCFCHYIGPTVGADPASRQTRRSHPELQPLAVLLHKKHALGYSDRDTPITPVGEAQARATGREMRASGVHSPDVIFVSPYLRTEQTLHFLQEEWPDLRNAKVYREERIRELREYNRQYDQSATTASGG